MGARPEATTSRVHLFFVKAHAALYRPLSINILREVCKYINAFYLLAIHIGSPIVQLNDLATGTYSFVTLPEITPSGASYCTTDELTLLYVGGTNQCKATKSVNLRCQVITEEPPMHMGRAWPGIVYFDSCVYVFGGNEHLTLKSCEVFSLAKRKWASLPDSLSPKVAFTPVLHNREIYLPAPYPGEIMLEVYTPATQQFRMLPLLLTGCSYGSVSFIYLGELFIFTYDKCILAWPLDSEKREAQKVGVQKFQHTGITNGRPVAFGNCMYWPDLNGDLVSYDLKTHVLTEPTRNR